MYANVKHGIRVHYSGVSAAVYYMGVANTFPKLGRVH